MADSTDTATTDDGAALRRLQNVKKDDLIGRLLTAEASLAAAHKERAEFEENVARVARQYAETHDWCSVVDEALNEAGVHRGRARRVRVTMSFDMTLLPTNERASEHMSRDDEAFIIGSIISMDGRNETIEMDDDFEIEAQMCSDSSVEYLS